jgi:hypothetical protein
MTLKSHITIAVATMASLAGTATAQPAPVPDDNWAKADVNLAVPDTLKPSGAHGTVVIEGNISLRGILRMPVSSQAVAPPIWMPWR